MPSNYALDFLGLFSVFALVLANAYFVATEFALVAVRRSEVKLWVGGGVPGARAVRHALDHLDDAIAATQLGITLASLALGWLGEPALADLLRPLLAGVGLGSPAAVHGIATTLAFTSITFLHVVVGELAPKAVALDRPGPVALACAGPLLAFSAVFRGVIRAMNGTGNALVRAFGVTPTGGATRVHSASELSLLTAEAVQAGELPAEQGPILERVFGLGARCVRDIMVPRARVFAAERHTPVDELLDRLREEGFTRLPIYEGDLDHVVGILHTKDLFHVISQTRLVVLEDALRPAFEIGPDVPLGKALRTFRREHRHMAIVREPDKQEMLGIVTLEDLLEQIVGAIEDEHD